LSHVCTALSKSAKKQCTVTALPIKKSYKSHTNTTQNNSLLVWLFLLFGRLFSFVLLSTLYKAATKENNNQQWNNCFIYFQKSLDEFASVKVEF